MDLKLDVPSFRRRAGEWLVRQPGRPRAGQLRPAGVALESAAPSRGRQLRVLSASVSCTLGLCLLHSRPRVYLPLFLQLHVLSASVSCNLGLCLCRYMCVRLLARISVCEADKEREGERERGEMFSKSARTTFSDG